MNDFNRPSAVARIRSSSAESREAAFPSAFRGRACIRLPCIGRKRSVFYYLRYFMLHELPGRPGRDPGPLWLRRHIILSLTSDSGLATIRPCSFTFPFLSPNPTSNARRVHVSYRAVLRGWAFRPNRRCATAISTRSASEGRGDASLDGENLRTILERTRFTVKRTRGCEVREERSRPANDVTWIQRQEN